MTIPCPTCGLYPNDIPEARAHAARSREKLAEANRRHDAEKAEIAAKYRERIDVLTREIQARDKALARREQKKAQRTEQSEIAKLRAQLVVAERNSARWQSRAERLSNVLARRFGVRSEEAITEIQTAHGAKE